jgi:hypothetical protein
MSMGAPITSMPAMSLKPEEPAQKNAPFAFDVFGKGTVKDT